MHYYQHHIGDFRAGTVNMSRQSRWIYRDMLDVYYDGECPLSMDLDVLCDAIGVESDEERKIVERLLRFKFIETPEGYRHERCDVEISNYHAKAEIAKANGKLGGRPRKPDQNPEKPSWFQSGSNPVPIGNPVATGSQANQEPITKNQKKKRGAKAPLSADNLPTWMQSLVSLYHEILPELPGVRVMDMDRDQALRDFWHWVMTTKRPDGSPRASNEAEALEWTKDYFNRARSNDFVMGRGPRSVEHANWRCSIEYLLSSRGMKKVIEETREAA